MADLSIPDLLAIIYEAEHNRKFLRLRRELERFYRQADFSGYKQEAYIDSVLAFLWESGFEHASLPAGQ